MGANFLLAYPSQLDPNDPETPRNRNDHAARPQSKAFVAVWLIAETPLHYFVKART